MDHSYSHRWSALLDRTAAAATERFRETGSQRLYLWRHRDGIGETLRWQAAAEPVAHGYEPVTPEPLSLDVPVSRYPSWLNERLRGRCGLH